MKKILIPILIVVFNTAQAQYSTYYNVDINQNVNAKINQNVNVNGTVYENKTITTIDYGALQLANTQNEKNRLEKIKYEDEQQRRISLEVATDPIKAYDYGIMNSFTRKGNDIKSTNFKKYTMSYQIPHNSLFVFAGAGRLENVSSTGVTTEIVIYSPTYNKNKDTINVEKIAKMESVIVGAINDKIGPEGQSIFIHKKDIRRANIFGIKGFKYTIIWEDNYQYTITDNYLSFDPYVGNGVKYFVKVRTYGDKDKITFEELEGRRYYLKQLIERIISTAKVFEMNY